MEDKNNTVFPQDRSTTAKKTKLAVDSDTQKDNPKTENQPKIVKTDIDAKDGQTKCPKCGATEITLVPATGKLKCAYCRHQFEPKKAVDFENDLKNLQGQVIGSGAQDISQNQDTSMMTLKCTSCGAEVVINTENSTSARCHWCRNSLSINQQIPNGAVPDMILPFSVEKTGARKLIEKFVGKRKFFAHPKFKKEFTTENIMGVYFPYMVVDINGHAKFKGEGEHLVRRYTVGSGDNKETRYDADMYYVEREFDITIDDLTIESSADKLNKLNTQKTTNIINSIMPFDTENCVQYDSNLVRGFTSEKRDVNINDLQPIMSNQAKDIAKFAANPTLTHYNRGVRWDYQDLKIKGQKWKAAYLPVWLYSYQQQKGQQSVLHYVAVNARTKETMGSVPIHQPKLVFFSIIVEFFGFVLFLLTHSGDDDDFSWIFLLSGIGFYFYIYLRYRNSDARHTYESETKKQVFNMREDDQFAIHRTGLRDPEIQGANNKTVSDPIAKGLLSDLDPQNLINKVLK